MESPVPKLTLTPSKYNRLPSLSEQKTADDNVPVIATERMSRDLNPREKKKKKKKKIKSRTSRRDSMMCVLRDELANLETLPALRSHRAPSADDTFLFRTDDDKLLQVMPETRRRRMSSIGAGYGRTRVIRTSSLNDEEQDVIVSGYELKKIRMMESLQTMGVSLPKKNIDLPSDEKEIMESMAYEKRQSLSVRLLQNVNYNQKRRRRSRSRSLEKNGKETPEEQSTSKEAQEKLDKMFNNMSRPVVDSDNKPPQNVPGRQRGSLTNDQLATESIGTFRRRIRRKKVRPFLKWKRLAKFLVILLRAWKIHSQSVNSILGMFDTLDALTHSGPEVELLFDVSKFKASKEAMISSEARRILEKPPGTRTEDEIYYIQIALRSYQSIVEYPVHMQQQIAERGWYESFDAKRVIVREGHIPMCFYFILTGSGVVTYMDPSTNQAKTVLFLNRGDSFGEQAIMTQSLRQTTVISREKIELLVLSDKDFVDIFMSGGLRDVNDPFIKSLKFLNEWPVEKMADNPKKAIFSFFKRGTVLVKDSLKCDWIFVVKSGSCSVLTKLKMPDLHKKLRKSKTKEWRQKIEESLKLGASLSHEDQVTLLCTEEVKKLEQQNLAIRFYALPEINIATNAAYNDLRRMHEEMVQQNSIKRAIEDLKMRAADGGSVITDADIEDDESTLIEEAKNYRRMSIVDLGNLVSKGPFMAKTKGEHSARSERSTTSYPTVEESDDQYNYTGYDVTQERASSNGPPSSKPGGRSTSNLDDRNLIFVNIDTLTKGQVFGLADIVYENQPQMSLVSNGVEVIMINKKFYMEYTNNNQLVRLRGVVWPYPSEEELQQSLDSQLRWNNHKKIHLKKVMRDIKLKKLDILDARAHLNVDPVEED